MEGLNFSQRVVGGWQNRGALLLVGTPGEAEGAEYYSALVLSTRKLVILPFDTGSRILTGFSTIISLSGSGATPELFMNTFLASNRPVDLSREQVLQTAETNRTLFQSWRSAPIIRFETVGETVGDFTAPVGEPSSSEEGLVPIGGFYAWLAPVDA